MRVALFGHRFDTLLHIWYGIRHTGEMESCSEVIKLFSCSTQLSKYFIMLIMLHVTFESLKAGKPLFQHFNLYEQLKGVRALRSYLAPLLGQKIKVAPHKFLCISLLEQ